MQLLSPTITWFTKTLAPDIKQINLNLERFVKKICRTYLIEKTTQFPEKTEIH